MVRCYQKKGDKKMADVRCKEWKCLFKPDGGLLGRYPWNLLREIGDQLLLSGEYFQPLSARRAAYCYAMRHGIKVTVQDEEGNRLRVTRWM